MKIEKQDVHSVIWAGMDKYEAFAWGMAEGSQKFTEAWYAHQRVWWKAYGKGCLATLAFYAVVVVGSGFLAKAFDNPLVVAIALGACGWHAFRLYQANRRSVTAEELSALLPALELTPNARLYAESLVELYSQPIDGAVRVEAVKELNRLMDDDMALERARASFTTALAQNHVTEIEEEIRGLQAKVQAAQDPLARATYEHSLSLAQERLTDLERYRPFVERVDAQQEVVRQTLLRVRSDLGRARASGTLDVTEFMPTLRTSLAGIRQHADEIERALEELRA